MGEEIFSKLFEPIRIGNVWIKNRIAMAPMGLPLVADPDGSINQRIIDYYVERAKGGVGLIITGLVKVEDKIEPLTVDGRVALPLLTSLKHVHPLSKLCEEVHNYGTRIFIQLTAGCGRVVPSLTVMQGFKPVAPSSIPYFYVPMIMTRALKKEEIEYLIKAFGRAAELAYFAGADGVELHGHEGYLLDQLTTAIWNLRNDEYGGSLENRLKVPIRILEEIRDRTGKDFAIVYRYGAKHFVKGYNDPGFPGEEFKEMGRDINEGIEMGKILEKAGYDALHVDAGCYDSWYMAHPPGYMPHGCLVEYAAAVKKHVKIPVIAVGRLDDPYVAAKVIAEGKADMVAIGRGLLADPYWPKKVKDGRIDDIRPCIGCHECLFRIMEILRPLGCAVNPMVLREGETRIEKAQEKKRILVIGGGVAGMEFARVAALRGHEVILVEKEKELGGLARISSVMEFKRDVGRLVEWFERQLKKLNVDIRTGVEADEKYVEKISPDAVVIATGSRPYVPNIPGVNKSHVMTALDVLRGKEIGENVIIVGAGLVGLELAMWLSGKGKKVTVLEMLPYPNLQVSMANRLYILKVLHMRKVQLVFRTRVKEITDAGLIAETPYGIKEFTTDNVVLATGFIPNRELYDKLRSKYSNVYIIGDALSPRKIKDAIWDAFSIALTI